MFSVTVSDADVDKVRDHREAPRCHRVLPAPVLPVGTQRCQGNRLPPADCARPQQVPLDVLWESRAELRLSLQSERTPLDSRQRFEEPAWDTATDPDPFCACVQAVIQVCDHTGSVCVVLWNSVCLSWYNCLNPGDIISLSHYRVKRRFEAESQDIGTVAICPLH